MSIIYTAEPAEVDPVLGRALNKLRHQPCTSSTQKGLRLQRLLAKAPGMTLMLPGPRRILFYHLPQILVILPNAWCDMLLRFFQSFHRPHKHSKDSCNLREKHRKNAKNNL